MGLSLTSSPSHPWLRPGAHQPKPCHVHFLFKGKNNKKSGLVPAQITRRANLKPCKFTKHQPGKCCRKTAKSNTKVKSQLFSATLSKTDCLKLLTGTSASPWQMCQHRGYMASASLCSPCTSSGSRIWQLVRPREGRALPGSQSHLPDLPPL